MIDDKSPAGSWRDHFVLMQVQRKKNAPARLCFAAPWYFEGASKLIAMSEIEIQEGIVSDLPKLIDCIASAVPNGTYTKGWAAKKRAKREGVRAGYPDLIIDGLGINAGKVFRAEIKSTSSVSVKQYEVLNTLWDNGHKCGVFRSLDTLLTAMKKEGWQ